MASSWRQFAFFNGTEVKDEDDDSLPGPSIFSSSHNGDVVVSGKDVVFIGDQAGNLHALNKSFQSICSLTIYSGGKIDHILTAADNLVATVGTEASGGLLLNVFEFKLTSGKSTLKALSTLNINSDKPFPITCCKAFNDLNMIALGFADGRVVLIKGDLVRDRGARQRTVYEGEEPITGLEFLASKHSTTLYIFSTSKTLTLTVANASGRSVMQVPRVMESIGAALNCVTKDTSRNELVVARQDAIYVYGVEGRGPCYALDGDKSAIYTFQGYSVLIQAPENRFAPAKVLGNSAESSSIEHASRLTILETNNKFIGHIAFFPQGLRTIFSVWDALYLVTMEGQLVRLAEVTPDVKMDILCNKNMYTLALSLAQQLYVLEEKADKIRVQYGDYLYSKGDYDASVKQYCQAIKQCDISAIMRRFLEAQHVPLLTEFLEALHDAKLSNPAYTTLLLNCYTKLKRKAKLETFIRNEGIHSLDIGIVVALCRQAGYFDLAISLTSKHKDNAICLGIMIEDKKDYLMALNYLKKSKNINDVGILLNRFGRELMSALPAETTKLFIDFYTGSFMPVTDVHARGTMSPPRRTTTGYGGVFYESMMNTRYAQVLPSLPSLDMSQFNPLRRVSSVSNSVLSAPESIVPGSTTDEEKSTYVVPSPRNAFHVFVDFPTYFVQFLEVILERQSTEENDTVRQDIVLTLLEAYLRQAKDAKTVELKNKWEKKATTLVVTEADYLDPANALLLFHLSSFEAGTILVQESEGRKEDVFRSYCTAKDTAHVVEMLHRYGGEEPQLYVLALKYFTSDSKIARDAGSELGGVLDQIREKKLLAPLQVIHALSMNAVATVGVVKSYLSDIIERERREILTNESLIASYRAESESKRQEAQDLANNARTLQISRCSQCNGTLELPVIHFLCKHSFHQRCVSSPTASGADLECPVCLESNNALRAVVKSKEELAERQEFFRESLAASKDKVNFLFSRLDMTTEPNASNV